MIKTYYSLIKPGIVYGNAITAIAGFLFATSGMPDIGLLLLMLGGISCIIASSCVFNNVIDRDIDTKMERTRSRALVTANVSVRNALVFGAVLGVLGVVFLLFTNLLTLAVALFGMFVYLALYTPLKRRTVHSTLVGAVSGAVPPVVGYVAVTNSLDDAALLLFLILVCWQMVHFFAIALFRLEDYRQAGLPVFPVRYNIARTKIMMLFYVVLFGYAAFTLYVIGRAGTAYAVVIGGLSFGWFLFTVRGFRTEDETRWAKRMFFYSLVVLLSFSLMLTVS